MALQQEEMVNIRRYLLGELTSEEREAIEERLLTDDDYFDQFQLAKEEIIDQYAEGEMTSEEVRNFEQHFLTTKERQESLNLARTLTSYSKAKPKKVGKESRGNEGFRAWVASLFVTPLRAAAVAVVAIAIVSGGFLYFRQPSTTTKGLIALNDAYHVERPIEARVSDFKHAPLANKRGGEPVQFDANARRRAEVMLQSAVESEPGAASYHALGKLNLFEGRFDDAVRYLEQALATDSNNPKIHSDLGAAWLEQGSIQLSQGEEAKGSESLANSLKHLNRALELDPEFLEALFNRALVRQQLKLFQLAAEDWKLYLTKDATSPWADEARQNLKSLEQLSRQSTELKDEDRFQNFLAAQHAADDETAWKLLSQNRSFTGSAIENRLLDEHLKAAVEGRTSEAREKLQVLSYAGALRVRRANDHFLSDLVDIYTTTNRQTQLAEGRRLLQSGNTQLGMDETAKALEFYSAAGRIFEQNGDACEALFVKYLATQARLLQGESKQALADFETVRTVAEDHHYRWLEGQSLNALANVHIGLNNFSRALELSQRSLEILKEINDSVGIAKVNDQLGIEYLRVGNPRQALVFHRRAVELVNAASLGALPLWRSYFTAAVPFLALKLDDAAIDFTQEALKLANETKSPVNVSRSYAHLGVMYGDRGNYDQAIAYIKQAFDSGQAVTTERVRLNALGYASLQLGNLYRHHGDFKNAIESYDEAIRLYDQMAFGAFSYVSHKGKFLACMAQGAACPSIEEELNTALRLFEEHRWKILETKNRYSFFDNEQSVYDVAIDYEFTTKDDKRKAFEYSERCRARSLLDLAEAGDVRHNYSLNADLQASASVDTAGLAQIQSEMTDRGQIVQYSVLADKVLIWFVSKEKFEGFEQPIASETLDEKVTAYLRLVASQSDNDQYERQRVSGELYDLLIKPVAHLLEGDKLVCFVPDKILNRLPFAALASPVDSSYLIEHYDLTFSPSSTMFIRRSRTQPDRIKEGSEKLFIVGDPKFDLKLYPSYTYLPAADLEARQIAKLYPSPEILTRAEATKSRVVDGMEKADVIHLATHAVVDEQSPMYSKLLLAKATDEPVGHHDNNGVLLTNEIYNLRLRARLVVLPACRTGVEQYYGGEGMVGIWSPFITRNVPLVVASLWSVDSDSTKELMINFHKLRIQRHISSAAALRQAQIAMLHGPDKSYQQPYHWAAFIAIGGYTQF